MRPDDTRPLALLTNDDGIRSRFLHVLAEAAAEHFRVAIVAPADEQSWIGRKLSRRDVLEVAAVPDLAGPAWTVSGTPSDAVNIGLDHLLDERPAVVLSGINVGYNTMLPLLLSSGTLAAAIEGAGWGIPSVAASQMLPRELFVHATATHGDLDPAFMQALRAAADRAVAVARIIAARPVACCEVHNLNFPYPVAADTEMVATVPERVRLGGLYAKGTDGRYRFRYEVGEVAPQALPTDRATLFAGRISHSVVDAGALGRPPADWAMDFADLHAEPSSPEA